MRSHFCSEEHASWDSSHFHTPRNVLDADVAYLILNFTTTVFVFPQADKGPQIDGIHPLGPERLPILGANHVVFRGPLPFVWKHKPLLTSGDALRSGSACDVR